MKQERGRYNIERQEEEEETKGITKKNNETYNKSITTNTIKNNKNNPTPLEKKMNTKKI